MNNEEQNKVSEEEIAPDMCEGIGRVLSSLYAHTSGNVLSATMAHLLLYQDQRFTFSHDFQHIPLRHLIDWCNGDHEDLTFLLRKVNNDDNKYDVVSDYFCNNILYRPTELEHTCCFEQIMCYELKKIQKKKKEIT